MTHGSETTLPGTIHKAPRTSTLAEWVKSDYIPKVGRVDHQVELSYIVAYDYGMEEERIVRFSLMRCGRGNDRYYELVNAIELVKEDPQHDDCDITWLQFNMMLGPQIAGTMLKQAMEMAP